MVTRCRVRRANCSSHPPYVAPTFPVFLRYGYTFISRRGTPLPGVRGEKKRYTRNIDHHLTVADSYRLLMLPPSGLPDHVPGIVHFSRPREKTLHADAALEFAYGCPVCPTATRCDAMRCNTINSPSTTSARIRATAPRSPECVRTIICGTVIRYSPCDGRR